MTPRSELFDYQLEAVAQLKAHAGDRPLLVIPTGGGKTVVAAHAVAEHISDSPLHRVVVLTHRREIAEQFLRALEPHGIVAGLVIGGVERLESRVQVCSVPSLYDESSRPPATMVVVDEAHHSAAKSWDSLIRWYLDRGARLVGLTATPFRLDRKALGSLFGRLVVPTTISRLIEAGRLVPPKVYCAPPPDLTGIAKVAGDYDERQLGVRMSKLCGDVVSNWLRLGERRKTILFSVNTAHSEACVSAFSQAGIGAAAINGSDTTARREQVLREFEDGSIDVLANCMIFSEGYDLPMIGCAVLARPTLSKTIHMQQIGRALRSAPGKVSAIVLDHAGNHHEHGLVTDPIDYELEREHQNTAKPPRNWRTCPLCQFVVLFTDPACMACGWVPPPPDPPAAPEHTKGDLVEFVPQVDRLALYTRWVIEASRKRAKIGMARQIYKDKFGVWPRGVKEIERQHYKCPKHEFERRVYGMVCPYCLAKRT